MVPLVSQALLRTGEAGVSLFEFVINPESFGQSVENLFYVSFLVKEGKAAVYPAELEDGSEGVLMLCEFNLPLNGMYLSTSVDASVPVSEEDASKETKKQQVFTLTPDVWRVRLGSYMYSRLLTGYIRRR